MSQKSKEDGWQGFLEICSKIHLAEEFGRFLDLFLTIEEKELLASRYIIIKALLEGQLTQREISETYKVSIAQITRGSNALKVIEPALKEFLLKKLS
ncbi:MAG: Trp operon repressor [Chlamydiae bacterium]|nr:Trp operon repressor [Chlamydiota bacterium]